MNVCVVCECGWIIKGVKAKETNGETIILHNASIVRKWYNGKGIGGIAKSENKDEYVLDPIGDVHVRANKVLFEIPCEW